MFALIGLLLIFTAFYGFFVDGITFDTIILFFFFVISGYSVLKLSSFFNKGKDKCPKKEKYEHPSHLVQSSNYNSSNYTMNIRSVTGSIKHRVDTNLTEYENWLNFISKGGTNDEWERLKKKNNWKFKESETEKFLKYQEELKPVSDKYYSQLEDVIKPGWSEIYQSKDYNSIFAKFYEQECLENIKLFKEMVTIEKKNDDYLSKRVPAYERLAMLYERQHKYEKALVICDDAIKNDASFKDMIKRKDRLLKKSKPSVTTTKNATILKNNNIQNDRKNLDPNFIDELQRIEASKAYRDSIWNEYYSDYEEKPFISKDRELNTSWLEQAKHFSTQSIIPKKIMKRYSDGLLPGHVYMLYWIDKYKLKRRIPAYFEYKYGIEFLKEKDFLEANGFIENNILTKKGKTAIQKHISVINNHKNH